MTYDQAIQELQAQIAAKGKFSLSNAPDYILGLASQHKQELQAMLDKLLQNKGVLTEGDQTALNSLLDAQKQAKKEKAKIITRNMLIGVGTVATGVAFWFTFKHRKK